MTGSDYSEYERRRAEMHEEAWRLAATLVNIRSCHCRYRVCRRAQWCMGPMLPSEHQQGMVRAQKEIGLSGTACANLPMCMANATPEHHTHVRLTSEKLTDLRSKELKDYKLWQVLELIRQNMRRQHRELASHLTSPARQPTSGEDTGGEDR